MEEWKKIKLKEVLTEVTERNKDEKVKNVLSVTNSQGFVSQEEYFEGTIHSQNTSNYKIVRRNQFAYNPSRVNVGSIDILRSYDEGALSPMYVVFKVDSSKLLPEYFNYYFKTHRFDEDVKNNTQGSVRNSLSFKALSSFEFLLPPIEEQKEIVELLDKINEIIKKKKIYMEKVRSQKKYLMYYFFKQSQNMEKRKFSEIFDVFPNNNLSRDKLNYIGGSYKNIHYGDILIKYKEIVNIKEDLNIPYINEMENNKLKNYTQLKDGDIIIADTAEDETAGKAVEIINANGERVLSGLHTIACRPKINFMKGYLGYYINSDDFHNQLIPLMQGIKVVGITKKNILNRTYIRYPNIDIQRKIVNTMNMYSQKESLLQRQVEEYSQLCYGLIQKLLAGKIKVKI